MRAASRPFLLMEVLVALALISLSISFLIGPHVRIYRNQYAMAEELARIRAADLAMAQVRQLLYENRIPWNKLRHGEKRPVGFGAPLHPVSAGGFEYDASFTLKIEEQKTKQATAKGQPKRDWRLLQIDIELIPKSGKKSSKHEYKAMAKRVTSKVTS